METKVLSPSLIRKALVLRPFGVRFSFLFFKERDSLRMRQFFFSRIYPVPIPLGVYIYLGTQIHIWFPYLLGTYILFIGKDSAGREI